MPLYPMNVPDRVVERALSNGTAGTEWLAELPGVVKELSNRWELTVAAALPGGTSGYVAEATDSSGRACVLKVAMPLDADEEQSFGRSVRAHKLAAGQGCAELLAHDDSVHAMLLERLGPNLAELGMAIPAILEAITDTLRSFWRPVASENGLRTGEQQARWLATSIETTWEQIGRPCERAVIDHALVLCERRAEAFDPTRAVLVHGDAHGWNTCAAGNGTYKFVDIEGLWSEREHDLGIAMREYNEPLIGGDTKRLVRERAEFLAQRCDADPQSVWDWGFIERVSTGLASLRYFNNEDGAMFLEVARRCR